MPRYTFVGPHPDSLASGRPLTFGTKVDEADERLIAAGWLVPDETPEPTQAPAPTEIQQVDAELKDVEQKVEQLTAASTKSTPTTEA